MLAVLDLACQEEPPTPEPDLSGEIYDETKVLEVAIDMDPAAWESLRHQVNSVDELLGDCQAEPPGSAYTYFSATVTVLEESITDVGVRKKGFFGSSSLGKPSLKLDFDEYVADREVSSVEKLTLNNSIQDTSLLKQCLAFKVFRDAGLPVSRCNLAHVVVNDQDLGVYVNVEGVTRRMLHRYFPDDSGNLYEGQLSDFRAGWTATYENKTNEDETDRSDIAAVIDALAASDGELEERLGAVLDLDSFFTFWAVESLIGAWDGYADNQNNHFVYHDPATDRMYFLPWSPDIAFSTDDPFMPDDRPQSVSANGAIAHRLYAVPALRDRYVERLRQLLDEVWDEDALLAELDRLGAQSDPLLEPDAAPLVAAARDSVREFITGRRAALVAELEPGAPEWPYDLRDSACYAVYGSVSGTFTTTWGTAVEMNPLATGMGTLSFDIDGVMEDAVVAGSAAGLTTDGKLGISPEFQVLGVLPSDDLRLVVMFVDPELWVPGAVVPLDWQSGFGYVLDIVDQSSLTPLGPLVHGEIRLDDVSTADGQPVSGSFSGELID